MTWISLHYQKSGKKRTLEMNCTSEYELWAKIIELGIKPEHFLSCLINQGRGIQSVKKEAFFQWYNQSQGAK